jgi:hypothetical protein
LYIIILTSIENADLGAQEILEEIEDNIDSEMGVSWTSIRCGIEELIKK